MLISQFAQKTGLGVDTVRYYVRVGLLQPGESAKGGRNPYQIFTADDVRAAQTIQLGQALGMSLKAISAFLEDYRQGRLTRKKNAELIVSQRDRLRAKGHDMLAMADYLDAKLEWLQSGGNEPDLQDFLSHQPRGPRKLN
ncbi:MerR family transcriptional regulator [Devosia neptuniae]|uniref:MerR family transcriptional regulator n=1 Tax=Devosia neptuniae TaxID=191302 RepID=UPI0022B00A7B|nr:MerR family transcriptional regulator [Devosia neptuniae]MCZ4345513.1 MerR family transcriptional regulator [Devosia neptuniae]